jgi:DNA-binding winged helix-turn-helix (wHTH) protein/Tol biopolymer transport system component
MNQQSGDSYTFGSFRLDARERLLICGGQPVPLAPKTFEALLLLVQNAGHLVTKDNLMKELWPDAFVEEANLTKHISMLRKVLNGTANGQEYIETIPKHGYRFVATVANGAHVAVAAAPAPSSPPLAEQTATAESGRSVAQRIRRGWQWLAAGAFVVAVLVGITVRVVRRHRSSPLPLKQRQLTINSSENAVVSGAISPDGRFLAYSDPKGIHIELIETGETQTLPQPEDLKGLQVNWGIAPAWALDGTRLIASANIPGQPPSVWTVSVMGGPPRKIRDEAFAYAISRDGSWVAFTTNPGQLGSRELWMMRPDGTQARKLYDAGEDSNFLGADWSPDGQRLGYVKASPTNIALESRDLEGGPPTLALPSGVADWEWSPDGRMIYSMFEPGLTGDSCNFWELRIDTRTGKPLQGLKRLTNWAGFCMDSPSATADGKRLSFRKWSWLGSVDVADLEANDTHLTSPRRLTLGEGLNYPGAWTADSKAVVFGSPVNGQWRIFKQFLGQETSELITTTEEGNAVGGRVSPDGAWILYMAFPRELGNALVQPQLMRIPVRGGPPQSIFAASIYGDLSCARPPSTLCAIAEQSPDFNQLIFTAFDPVRGRGEELIRFDIDAKVRLQPIPPDYMWDLSPDGTRIAILKYSEGRIHVLHLSGHARQEISVKGWNSLLSVNWIADGKGFFVSSATNTGSALLHVDLQGNAHILWEQKGSIAPWNGAFTQWLGGPTAPRAIASPDGRHLAIYSRSWSANMWMMENY